MKIAPSGSTLRRMRVFGAILIALAIMFVVVDAAAAAEGCGENAVALDSPAGHGDYIGEVAMTQSETRYPELTAGLVTELLDSE